MTSPPPPDGVPHPAGVFSPTGKPRILVTNDDGIDSEGLVVLARAMVEFGDVVVVAPDREYSGASAALGALEVIRPEAHRAHVEGLAEAWALSGPPALCVVFATMGAFGDPFDLVVAGINPGANVGRAVYHSGTVGAAVTARIRGVNAVAVSQAVQGSSVEGQGHEEGVADQLWDTAASVAGAVVAGLLAQPPRQAVAVNLNVPNLDIRDLAGWRSTTVATLPGQALSSASLRAKPGHPGTFHVDMAWGEPTVLASTTDVGAVANGEVSITLLGPCAEEALDTGPGLAAALNSRWGRR